MHAILIMKKTFLFLVFIWFTNHSVAQLHEIGVSFGGSNYVGDIGSTALLNPSALAYGAVYKYNKNPRIAYRVSFTSMGIKANNSDSNNEIRQLFDTPVDKTINEFTAGIEFNFFEYQISHWKKARTPYFIFELAFFQYEKMEGTADNITSKSTMGFALPFGIGYKAQLSNQLVLGFEARIRYTYTDDIDDGLFYKEEIIKDHPEISKFNNPDTNDWYAFTGLTLTYTFGRPLSYTTRRR